MSSTPIAHHFNAIPDPRAENHTTHRLIDIIMVSICATLAGAVGWQDMTDFGKTKESWLKTFLWLPGGISSPDTFARVFSLLDPEQFQAKFVSWMHSVVELTHGQIIAIDGKTSVGSGGFTKAGERIKPLHLVSAFAVANGVTLGQTAADQKSNEITAIPELLKLLDIKGCLITTDAMGCQADIAADIVARGGDYLLAVKGNQGHLYADIKACFVAAVGGDKQLRPLLTTNISENTGHGRVEKRICEVMSGPDVIVRLRHKNNWLGLSTIVKVSSERTIQKTGALSTQTRYYLSSLVQPTAQYAQAAVRAHWGIENSLHWVIDTALREDASKVRTDHAPENLAVLRHIALNLVRADTTRKTGVQASLRKAGWDTGYLAKLIGLTA